MCLQVSVNILFCSVQLIKNFIKTFSVLIFIDIFIETRLAISKELFILTVE